VLWQSLIATGREPGKFKHMIEGRRENDEEGFK
jgi:hypothetical protein